jgi:hypothetical protein
MDCGPEETSGILYVNEHRPLIELVAMFAHELGHACTVPKNLKSRGRCLEDEWASELTALWYTD